MNWHSLLDWRLGLGMLRLLSNASYKSGADGKFDDFVEIRGWPAFAEKLRNQFIDSFQEFSGDPREYKIMFKGLPAIRYGKNKQKVLLIVHPFWNIEGLAEDAWYTEAFAEAHRYVIGQGGSVEHDFNTLDTFNLHRRIGWCYEKLLK